MQILLLGLVLLVVVLVFGRAFARADPKKLAKNLRRIAGWASLAVAVFLVARGQFVLAVPLAFFGLSLLGKSMRWPDVLGGGPKASGQKSSVRTGLLEMTLDHDTGDMDGLIFTGAFAGRRLSGLSDAELGLLLDEALQSDEQAAQLLQAFIERKGERREERQSARGAAGSRTMTADEAYEVLGLKPGATRDDIHQAHRALMKKYHPDQGGTTYLAAKINEAKDLLLKQTA